MALGIETEQKNKNLGNITSIILCVEIFETVTSLEKEQYTSYSTETPE